DFVNLLCVSKSVKDLCLQFPLFAELNKMGFYCQNSTSTKLEVCLKYNNYLWMKYYTAEKFQLISNYKYPYIFRNATFTTLIFLYDKLHNKQFSKNLAKINNVNLVLQVLDYCEHEYYDYLKYLCRTAANPQIIDFCLNKKP